MAVVFRLTLIVGVVWLVMVFSTLTVGAMGAVLSSAWAWAPAMVPRLVAVPMAVDASAMALCAAALTLAEAPSRAVPNILVIVVESAKLMSGLPSLLVVSTVARLLITLAPALVEALSARATMVATWAAAFCAANALLCAVGSVEEAAAIGS